MTALAFTVLAVALVAGPLYVALTHHRQETTMPEIHYLSPHGGMIHAIPDFTGSFTASGDWAKVTCTTCLAQRPPSTTDLIAGLSEEPKAMTLSHDRLILQRADQEGGARVVVVKCPHTIGLCIETDVPEPGFLGLLPCPCNDRSAVTR